MTLEEFRDIYKHIDKSVIVELLHINAARIETLREVCDNMSAALEWKTTPPPRDREILILNEYNMPVAAHWNGPSEEFAYANLRLDCSEGKQNDYYFDTEWIKEEDVKGWREL